MITSHLLWAWHRKILSEESLKRRTLSYSACTHKSSSRESFYRHKRDDDCLDCQRPYSKIDRVFSKFSHLPNCKGLNYIVCKNCKVEQAVNVTLHAVDQGFEAWCFGEEGLFKNLVNSLDISIAHFTSKRERNFSKLGNIAWNVIFIF